MIRQEFGIYDENFNDGLLNEEGGIRFGNNTVLDDTLRLDDDFRGGGGGGITRGGGISTVINGCTDPNAKNYNRFATRDDGSCFYNPPPLPVVNDKSKSITFTITTENKKPSNVVVDGVVGQLSRGGLTFTEKELLTPKIINVVSNNKEDSVETYRVKTVQRVVTKEIKPVIEKDFDDDIVIADFQDRIKFSADIDYRPDFDVLGFGRQPIFNIGGFGNTRIPPIDYDRPTTRPTLGIAPYIPPRNFKKPSLTLGKFDWSEYHLIVEKRNSDGEFVFYPTPKPTLPNGLKLVQKSRVVPLFFSFEERNPLPIVNVFDIQIKGDVSSDEIIRYTTSDGQTGLVRNGLNKITVNKIGKDTSCYIQFNGVGINDYSHQVEYKYENNVDKRKGEIKKGIDSTFNLSVGENFFVVTANKQVFTPDPNSPSIKVENNNVIFNIANSDDVNIVYDTTFADKVIYTLGKVEREIGPSGVLTLQNSDFPNGVGRYVVYLQPVSKRGGSGEIEKIIVTVESKAYLPGPDITHINFPQNIKGADFKEYNIDFEVSWQSINTNYILIYAGKVGDKNLLKKVSPSGNTKFNVAEIIRIIGSDLD